MNFIWCSNHNLNQTLLSFLLSRSNYHLSRYNPLSRCSPGPVRGPSWLGPRQKNNRIEIKKYNDGGNRTQHLSFQQNQSNHCASHLVGIIVHQNIFIFDSSTAKTWTWANPFGHRKLKRKIGGRRTHIKM